MLGGVLVSVICYSIYAVLCRTACPNLKRKKRIIFDDSCNELVESWIHCYLSLQGYSAVLVIEISVCTWVCVRACVRVCACGCGCVCMGGCGWVLWVCVCVHV